MWESLQLNGEYISRNWIAQFDRYPWTQDPFRVPGISRCLSLPNELRTRAENIRLQLGSIAGICPCRVSEVSRIVVEPGTVIAPFSVSSGLQAVIDLQTGDLFISREPINLARPAYTDWQQFLQYSINA